MSGSPSLASGTTPGFWACLIASSCFFEMSRKLYTYVVAVSPYVFMLERSLITASLSGTPSLLHVVLSRRHPLRP